MDVERERRFVILIEISASAQSKLIVCDSGRGNRRARASTRAITYVCAYERSLGGTGML